MIASTMPSGGSKIAAMIATIAMVLVLAEPATGGAYAVGADAAAALAAAAGETAGAAEVVAAGVVVARVVVAELGALAEVAAAAVTAAAVAAAAGALAAAAEVFAAGALAAVDFAAGVFAAVLLAVVLLAVAGLAAAGFLAAVAVSVAAAAGALAVAALAVAGLAVAALAVAGLAAVVFAAGALAVVAFAAVVLDAADFAVVDFAAVAFAAAGFVAAGFLAAAGVVSVASGSEEPGVSIVMPKRISFTPVKRLLRSGCGAATPGQRGAHCSPKLGHRAVELLKLGRVQQGFEHPVALDEHDRRVAADGSCLSRVEFVEVLQLDGDAQLGHEDIPFAFASERGMRDVTQRATDRAECVADDVAQLATETTVGVVDAQNPINHRYPQR